MDDLIIVEKGFLSGLVALRTGKSRYIGVASIMLLWNLLSVQFMINTEVGNTLEVTVTVFKKLHIILGCGLWK